MKRKLMDFLACAMCKSHPLELYVFVEGEEIVEGLLVCPNPECRMWYPIIEEIPHCLPPDLRQDKDDLEFLRKWKSQIPEKVLKEGRPFNLSAEMG
ncbi:MAG: Trm112 family protein [Candidatus Bathyarchaeia archaeon]